MFPPIDRRTAARRKRFSDRSEDNLFECTRPIETRDLIPIGTTRAAHSGEQNKRSLGLSKFQSRRFQVREGFPEDRPISMTVDQGRYVLWFTLAIVPLLLFFNGFRVWWRKR
jgi:hypothetical protein